MKQLRHILYLTEPDIALKVEGQALCAVCGDGRKEKIPFHLLEGIVSFSYAGITPAVLTACAGRGIPLTALTPSGHVRFQVIGETRGNVLLRMRQYELSGQEDSFPIMRAMLSGKLQNCRKVLERFARNHPDLSQGQLEHGRRSGALHTLTQKGAKRDDCKFAPVCYTGTVIPTNRGWLFWNEHW